MGLTNNLGRLSDALTTDASLNVGIGVTPSAWASNLKVFQAASGAFFGYNNGAAISSNAFFDGSWKYINNAFATYYEQNSGQHYWSTAPSGTAGAAITFTQAMTLNASGRLLLGTTTDTGQLLQVNGTGNFSSSVTALGNGTSAGYNVNNNAAGAQHYIDFTAGATTIVRMLRGNGAAGLEANGLNIDNFAGFKIRLNQLGGSGGSFTVDNGNVTLNATVYANTATATVRTLYIGGNYTIGGISSIRESKINIEDFNNVNWIYDLNPVSFNYRKKDEQGKFTDEFYEDLSYGLIAEDVELVNNLLCNYDEVEGSKKLLGIEYPRLIIPMLKAIQELKSEIETLKNK